MVLVFFRKNRFGKIQPPVNAERRVDYRYAAVCFGTIEVVALILENGGIAQHGESVGEATRDEELTMVVFSE